MIGYVIARVWVGCVLNGVNQDVVNLLKEMNRMCIARDSEGNANFRDKERWGDYSS